jgi:hypothetical protein
LLAVTLTNLQVVGVGTFTLTFTSPGLTAVTSSAFTVTAGPATRVAITTQPSATATSGVAFATQPVVQLRDVYGNPVASAGIAVTAAIASGGGTLGGTAVVSTDGSGRAGYTNLAITGSDGGRTLSFSAPGLASATSASIMVSSGSTSTTLLFASDWSSGVGQTATAILDATKPLPWNSYEGNGWQRSGIESAQALGLAGWPTANAFVVRAIDDSPDRLASAQIFRDIGSPAPGSHRYYRLYVAMLWSDAHGDGTDGMGEHGIESADVMLGGGTGFNVYMVPRSNGTWWPAFRELSTSVRYIADGLSLSKNATYRLEWHLAYGTGSYTVQLRIYNAAGTLVADDRNFYMRSPMIDRTQLLSNASFTLADFADHRWFRVGTNGPGTNYPLSNIVVNDPFRAHGAVAVCGQAWCGPYVAGERP